MSSRRRAVVISNDEPDSSYGAHRLSLAFEESFDTELFVPLGGFGAPRVWLKRVRADVLVVSGSDRSVLTELPWMREEEAVLRAAVELGTPTLAVCFGHQLLAKAMGARIVTRKKRVGLSEVEPVGRDPVFAGVDGHALVPEQHSDQVEHVPDGFVLTATSDYCRVQAMRHEESPVYGVQFHPCYDDEVFDVDEAWIGLDVPRPLSHDGPLILANTVRLFEQTLA